ncbi:hypothetical protein HDA32_004788 [Spinactinospora alkalitolerans]|uniref:Uncharacterized protein n=1 Tax=Spinactinospora alkalitolerans TaxID=687207 RepID=A0A852U0E4_9ACTN|nr:hypothetical protein [Spinactinospora alkalitolerans]NYE49668.1 hypothetical protein [Spinactinospora alkalitolerans]
MNNEAIHRLREPAAWALLGAVAVQMLAGLINIFGAGAGYGSVPVAGNMVDRAGAFFGPVTVALIVVAVLLMITAPKKSPRTFPVVLAAMILLGIGAVFGVITLIMGFLTGDNAAVGFSNFFVTVANLAILVFAGLFLMRLFGDQTLVPRSAGPQQQAFPQGGPSPMFPQTGAQASFAPQADPAQTGQGYQAGAQQPQQDWAAQQNYADPGLTGSGQTGWPQQGGDVYAQPAGYDQGRQAQPGYGQAPAQDWAGRQDVYGQYPAGYTQTGAQQSYAEPQYGQQPEQPPYAGQPGYSGAEQPGYDPYGQQAAQQPYGTGGQAAYGSAYDPGQVSPSGGQPAQSYGTGGQAAYGSAYDPGQVSPSGGQPAQSYGTGGQAAYGSAYDPGQAQPAGDQAAQPYGYDASQQGYGTGADSEATIVQNPVTGAPGGGYPASDATIVQNPGTGTPGGYPADEHAQSSERAAQEAVQYGWYQQAQVGEGGRQQGQQPEQRRDTPLEPFFHSDEQNDSEATMRVEPGYGGQYGTGGYPAQPHDAAGSYGDNHPSDQPRHSGSESDDRQQGWYRDDDRR